MEKYELLENINSPDDLKKLDKSLLPKLCEELREKIISTVAENGGHLSSNLGVIELTVALHLSFNSPEDQIVWDVGHQCYAHKLLTGRFSRFSTLRKKDGLSGFTNPEESEHDIFYSGHSSTSLSAAYGLAKAKKIKGEKGFVVAVIGDGSLTGGEAYEGLNNAYADADNLIIIVNDNQMSISKNGSSLAQSLSKIRSTKAYYRSKQRIGNLIVHIPLIGKPIRRKIVKYKYALKGVLYHSSFFEDLGYAYLGPVDGHNVRRLEDMLEIAKLSSRACIIHVDTVKGKGYMPAQIDPTLFHGVGPFNKDTGEVSSGSMTFSKSFGDSLCLFAQKDKRICAVTAAMPSGTGLEKFAENFKDRYFDVGIAEQHAVTFSSGLAKNGMIPIFAVYSTFLQRSYDQLIHDISLQEVKVIFAVDRAGFAGSDGQTHQGLFDIAMFNTVPKISIYAPASYEELSHMMYTAIYKNTLSSVIRYPRGSEGNINITYDIQTDEYSVYNDCESSFLIIGFGKHIENAVKAADILKKKNISVPVLKLNIIKPISESALNYAKKFKNIYFYEEGIEAGGVGEQLAIMLTEKGFCGKFILKAVKETFVKPASTEQQYKEFGLDTDSIVNDIGVNFEKEA